MRVVACSFQRFSCGHGLFNATYTRSNRTKGTKIMRCFPHCCPEHMPRCYCGCSLHVLVTFEDLAAVRLDELVVCARFETSETQQPQRHVPVGREMAVPRAVLSPDVDDANATTWIVAERESDVKQQEVAQNSVLYVMNNHRFPRWYYGYESGATKNQRDMQHHLTAYVFQRSQAAAPPRADGLHRVEVLARLPSPAFKLVSYRRARGEVKKPAIPQQDDPLAALEDHGSSTEDEGAPSASAYGTPTKADPHGKATAAYRGSVDSAYRGSMDYSSGNDSPGSAWSLSETRVPDVPALSLAKELARRRANSSPFVGKTDEQQPASRQRGDGEGRSIHALEPTIKMEDDRQCDSDTRPNSRKRKIGSPGPKSLWWRQRSDDAQRLLHLHVLFVMLNRLTLHDVMFCLRERSERLRKKWFAAIATLLASRNPGEEPSRQVAELAHAFCLSAFAEEAAKPPSGVEFTHTSSRDVIAMCLDVLLEVVTSDAVKQLLQATWQSHQSTVLESEQVRELFMQFVRRLYGAIDTTVRKRRQEAPPAKCSASASKPTAKPSHGGGVAALVDDAMTAVFQEKRLASLRRDMVEALSDSTLAAERWYEVFVAQLRVAWVRFNERKVSGISLLWQVAQNPRYSPVWNGKWLLDATSFSVRRPGGWFQPQQQNAEPVVPLGSLVSWIVLLRQWLGVELTMDGNCFIVRSLLGDSASSGMRLVLDERQRVLKTFPDGLASTIGFGGGDRGAWLHGDYVGRGSDASSDVLCETYSIRQRATTEILRMCIKATIYGAAAVSRRCVVTAQLASASCESFSAEQIVTWPVRARYDQLYASVQWTVLADVEAAYRDVQ